MLTFKSTITAYRDLLIENPGKALVLDKGIVAVMISGEVYGACECHGVVDKNTIYDLDSDAFDEVKGCWGGDGDKTLDAIKSPSWLSL